MSNQIIPDNDSTRAQDWVHIDDFSAGCYDNSYISTAEPVLSAPLGAANAENTFCCASLQNGGLGPLPQMAAHGYSNSFPGALTKWWITGVAVNPGLDADAPEIVFIMEGDDGTTHYVLATSYVPATAAANTILSSDSTTTPGIFGAPYPAWTRMVADPTTAQPEPVLVWPGAVATDSNSDSGHLYEYPNIASRTTFAAGDLVVPGDSVTGQVICYGNRVLVLAGINYDYPAGGGINTNENINFTDPPQSATYGFQQTILSAEEPWGYGAWGSISTGELLLLKKYGGGVMLNGDIDDPSSVIPLPGIESVGAFVGHADSSTIGLVYCSQSRGAWIWNGGNTSQKISAQLRDNFFDATTEQSMPSNNYGFFVGHWQDWILFSNNYMYDADSNAWWVLYPKAGNGNADVTGETFFWYNQAALGSILFASPLSIGTGMGENLNWYYQFDNSIPAQHWQWESLPIVAVPNHARVVDVTQVIVRASCPTGAGSAFTITIGTWTATSVADIGLDPTTFRFNAGAGSLGLEDIIITITGDDTTGTPGNSAPIIHSIDVGYTTRAMNPSDN